VRTPLPDLYPAIALERSQYLGGFRHVSRVTVREARDSCPSRTLIRGAWNAAKPQEAL